MPITATRQSMHPFCKFGQAVCGAAASRHRAAPGSASLRPLTRRALRPCTSLPPPLRSALRLAIRAGADDRGGAGFACSGQPVTALARRQDLHNAGLRSAGPSGASVAGSLRCQPPVISVMYKPFGNLPPVRKGRARLPYARQPGAVPWFVLERRWFSGAAQGAAPRVARPAPFPACHSACMSRTKAANPT